MESNAGWNLNCKWDWITFRTIFMGRKSGLFERAAKILGFCCSLFIHVRRRVHSTQSSLLNPWMLLNRPCMAANTQSKTHKKRIFACARTHTRARVTLSHFVTCDCHFEMLRKGTMCNYYAQCMIYLVWNTEHLLKTQKSFRWMWMDEWLIKTWSVEHHVCVCDHGMKAFKPNKNDCFSG